MQASRKTINEFFIEDHALGLIFLGGVFGQGEILEVLDAWFERELTRRVTTTDRVNCIVDLGAVDFDWATPEEELGALLVSIEDRIPAGNIEKVALVSGLANYELLSKVMDRTRDEGSVTGNFYSLDNACHWLLGAGGDVLQNLAPCYGEFRHELRPIKETGLVVRYLSGRVTRERMLGAMEQLLAAPFYSPGCQVLTDSRDANFTDVGAAGSDIAEEVFQRFAASAPGRSAYVFGPEDYPKAEHYKALFASQGREVMPFSNLREACTWVGHDQRQVQAALDAMRVGQFFASSSSLDLRDWLPEICETGRADPALQTSDAYRDHYIVLPEMNLLVRRLAGPCSAAEFISRTAWMEAQLPYLPGQKILLDIRAWELSQPDRLYFSQGANGTLDTAVRGAMATLCGPDLLHVAEGFAAVQKSWQPKLRAVTTPFSASAWLGLKQALTNRCLELLQAAQGPK
ncbi:MAG: hypothetical protein MUP90_18210 [Gammaproteobacteria bacterium]|nr:hypothetical protein [Gammaproteobacteria bacterium]